MRVRTERDSMGEKRVPAAALYGVHTQRAVENFQISGIPMSLEICYAIAEIKIAATQTNKNLRLLSSQKAEVIIKAAQEILQGKHDQWFVLDAFQAGAGTATHMNINEVIANRALELLHAEKGNYKIIHPNDDVNKGQSTNDVFPSAIKIVCFRKIHELIPILQELQKELLKKSKEFGAILKIGRTHLQDAVPLTLGQEFHAYATTIGKDIERLHQPIGSLLELNLGGNAIGTGINNPPQFAPQLINNLRKQTDIAWKESQDKIYATQNVSIFLEVSETLRLLAVDLTKLANDFRLLSSGPHAGFAEISLPAVEPGSSIMPGKINPSIAEMLNMVCFQVIGNDQAVLMGEQAGQLELNVMMPLMAKNLVDSFSLLINGVRIFTKRCVKGIKANKKHCQYYVTHSAELATLLNPYLGYEKAAEIVNESLKTGETVYEVVKRKRLLEPSILDKIFEGTLIKKKTRRNVFKKKKQHKKR